MQALIAANQAPPPPLTGTFLIDTGASGTCIDDTFISQLGLQPTGVVPIKTPSTGGGLHHCNQFDVSMFIPGGVVGQGYLIEAIPIISTHLQSQGIDGLIGRDVLDNCTLIYNGTAHHFTLAY
ncbi:retropepsin-like aspartic protease [Bradyrhizobium sp. SZCCHNR3058]|uniref:retropepsin-like aspartic protease n=1 Tax=Bradyrhizobium sp. SZCCHNR3058 TaxID=3057423 RepID=UPI0029162B19|nr:retropepsin-like aspartic protease [Bradyrhizobium sp. SZCCHNR3058]